MSTTREYEITYIVDPALDEAKRGEINAAIDSKIDELKGMTSSNSETTRRKLAYPIHKQRVGFMRLIQAQLLPEAIFPLRQAIIRLEGVLRFTIIQSAPRLDVTSSFFDVAAKPQTVTEPKKTATAKKPVKEISDAEVEEKIAEALDEEVK